MSLKVDRLQLEIIINNDQARKSLRLLDDQARAIQKSMKGMKEGSDEWIQSTKRLSSVKSQMDSIHDSIGITGLTMKELIARQKEFNLILSNLDPNNPKYKEYDKTLGQVNARINELRANSKALSGVLNQQGSLMSQMMGKMGEGLLKLGAAGVALFSLNAIKDYFKTGIEAAMKLRDTERLLLEELDGNKLVQGDLIKLAKERSSHTKYGRQEIEEAEKFLAIQQRTPEQMKKIIMAATDLAAITGGSLSDATRDLDATLQGRLSKGLGKLSKDFKDLSKEQMYNGDAIDIIGRKYKGLAEKEMNTTEGKLILLGKAWKALQRNIGETFIGGGLLESFSTGVTNFLNSISKGIAELNSTKSAVDRFEQQGRSVAKLVVDIDPLLDRYDQLKSKTMLNATEQNELKDIINQVSASMPGAVSAFDKYGNAIEISSQRVRDYMKDQLLLLRYDNKKAIEETISSLAEIGVAVNKAKPTMTSITKTGTYTVSSGYHQMDARKATNEEIAETIRKNQELLNTQIALNTKLSQLRGDALQQSVSSYKADKDAATEAAKNTNQTILDLKKASQEELDKYVSRAREDGASNSDRTLSRHAQDELNRRKKASLEAEKDQNEKEKEYEKYMDLMREIAEVEKTNYAQRLSQTQGEIKAVNEKYDNEIRKIQEYKEHNSKTLSPQQNTELDSKIGGLEIARDAQTKQVLVQAEQDFADKVKLIYENLRVARMSVTARQVYDVNKKYDDLQKEILDAIDYRYQQEIIAANGNAQKIIEAENRKKEATAKIQKDLSKLEKARQNDINAAKKDGLQKFDEELKNLQLKSDLDLAKGKDKIQLQIDKKYKKILDQNINDAKRTEEIKAQMAEEFRLKELEAEEQAQKKKRELALQYAQTVMGSITSVSSAWSDYQNAMMLRDQADNDKKKATLKKQLDSKLISQKQYDIGVAKLDAEADKKKRKLAHDQAVIAKATNVTNAIINTAVGITSALALEPAGIALAIIVGILGAAQIGLILATPVPQAAAGRYNVTGMDDGKKYNNVPYLESFTGIPGNPMLVNETGNEIVIDPYTTRNIQMNYPYIIEGINQAKVPQRAGGLYPDAGIQKTAANAPVVVQFHPDTLKAMDDFKEQIKKPLGANIVYDNLMDSINRVTEIQANVTK